MDGTTIGGQYLELLGPAASSYPLVFMLFTLLVWQWRGYRTERKLERAFSRDQQKLLVSSNHATTTMLAETLATATESTAEAMRDAESRQGDRFNGVHRRLDDVGKDVRGLSARVGDLAGEVAALSAVVNAKDKPADA